MASISVIVEGQDAYLAAVKRAQQESYKATQAALRKVGDAVVPHVSEIAPVGSGRDRHPGKLKASYRARVARLEGYITSTAPYAAGAEWGFKGKWKGFVKYGPPGRFAWKVVQRMASEIAEMIERELTEIVTVYAWFR